MSPSLQNSLFYRAVILSSSIFTVTPVMAQANAPETNYQRIMNSVNDNAEATDGQPASDTGGAAATTAGGTGGIAGVTGTTNTDSQQPTEGYSPKNISIYGQPEFHQSPGATAINPGSNPVFGNRTYNTYAPTVGSTIPAGQ